MDSARLAKHVEALNACNQRGGRMLSLIDLLEAGTVDLASAAYLAAALRMGASLLVGALPGGAGKTSVMCALLNFLPDATSIRAVDSMKVLEEGRSRRKGGSCYLAHEVGDGPYYAYVWGTAARAFFRLAREGHQIATNLHADTLEQTQVQLVQQNGVEPDDLLAVHLKLYLRLERGSGWSLKRRVSAIYESDGTSDRLLWESDADACFRRLGESALVTEEQERAYGGLLDALRRHGIRTLEDVRRALLELSS